MRLLVALSLLFTGCASTLVERTYEPYKGGMIKYMNGGASFVADARVKDADEKMRNHCEGSYKIISEGVQRESNSLDYAYIKFRCDSQ